MTLRDRPVLYSSKEAAELAGVSYRMLDHMIRTQVFSPAVGAEGTGYNRRFSLEDIVALRVTQFFADSSRGYPLWLREACRLIQSTPFDDLEGHCLVVAEGRCWLSSLDALAVDVAVGDPLMVVPLDQCRQSEPQSVPA